MSNATSCERILKPLVCCSEWRWTGKFVIGNEACFLGFTFYHSWHTKRVPKQLSVRLYGPAALLSGANADLVVQIGLFSMARAQNERNRINTNRATLLWIETNEKSTTH